MQYGSTVFSTGPSGINPLPPANPPSSGTSPGHSALVHSSDTHKRTATAVPHLPTAKASSGPSDKALSFSINSRSINFRWNVLLDRKSFCSREVQVPHPERPPGLFSIGLWQLCSALRTSLANRDAGAAGREVGTDFKQGQGSRRSNANGVIKGPPPKLHWQNETTSVGVQRWWLLNRTRE